jgi:hypothetical protein
MCSRLSNITEVSQDCYGDALHLRSHRTKRQRMMILLAQDAVHIAQSYRNLGSMSPSVVVLPTVVVNRITRIAVHAFVILCRGGGRFLTDSMMGLVVLM